MTAARRRILRWGLQAAVLVTLAGLWYLDARMKDGGPAGFVPANADWVAYTPQFSRAWSGLSRTSAFRDFNSQWPIPYHEARLAVRTTSGIRPTPLRWSTWLGKKAVVFGSEEGVGWCVKPGLLIRGAHSINAMLSNAPSPGNFRYGPYYYSWREGFLLFSTSAEVLQHAAGGTEFRCNESVARDEVYLEWRGNQQGFVVISARNDLPVRGEMELAAQGTGEGTVPWPEVPFFELSSTECSVVRESVKRLRQGFALLPSWTGLANVVPDFNPMAVGAKYPNEIAECGLALLQSNNRDSKVPAAAMRFRFHRDIPADLQVAIGGVPIEGWAVSGKQGYLATGKNLLETLMSQAKEEVVSPGTFVARVDWSRAAKAFEIHFRDLLSEDETLGDSIEGIAIPATQGMAALGRLHLQGSHENDRLVFKGTLAKIPPKQPQD